jgi:hypothetical protein
MTILRERGFKSLNPFNQLGYQSFLKSGFSFKLGVSDLKVY